MKLSFSRVVPTLAALSLGSAPLLAHPSSPTNPGVPIVLSGSVSDGAGGPLLSGQLYHTNGFNVPVGTTLTVQPGAVIKTNGGLIVVDGTLNAIGTAGSPITFTSDQDDSICGDSYLDGATTGAPADWSGIRADPTGVVNLAYSSLSFAGAGGWRAVYGSGGTISVDQCTFSNCSGSGIDLNNNVAPAAVTNSDFVNNTGHPMEDIRIEHLPNFSGNTASGNGFGDVIETATLSPTADATLTTDNLINDVLRVSGSITVPAGVTLTLEEGVLAKMSGAQLWNINGTLRTLGTALDPVVFTSLEDDSFGGDSAADGPTVGAPADWSGIRSITGGFVDLDHTILRHAGGGGWRAVYGSGGGMDVTNCTIENGSGPGIDFNNVGVSVNVANCAIDNNSGVALDECPIEQVPNLSNNTASGNTLGDAVRVTSFTLSTDLTIEDTNLIGDVLVLSATATIPSGVTLTMKEGIGVKHSSATIWNVSGTLRLDGDEGNPVVFTSLEDDDYFGDTASDGPTSGSPGDWDGIRSITGGSLDFDHAVVRYAGAGGWRPIYGSGGAIKLLSCEILDAIGPGIDFNSVDAGVEIVDCDIDNNGGTAVVECPLTALAGFDSNRASGNAGGNYIESNNATPSADVTIEPRDLIGGALVVPFGFSISAPNSLTIAPGTVLKFKAGQLTVNGTLNALGTGLEPVVFTSFEDDSFAGDTNDDGAASVAGPGDWDGLRFSSSSTGSIEHSMIRFGGAGGWENLRSENGASIVMHGVRSEFSSTDGFELNSTGGATNLVAYGNDAVGIRVINGAFDLVHATSAENGSHGIEKDPSYTGVVRNSIAWGNTGDNFRDFVAGEVVFSNGTGALSGANGNLDVDPLFADASPAVRDLRLGTGSPAIDAADFLTALATVTDVEENSRIIRTGNAGLAQADMGAYERVLWRLSKTGSSAAGETFDLQVDGRPGLAFYVMGLMETNIYLDPHGYLLTGLVPLFSIGGAVVGAPLPFPVPAGKPALIGLNLGVQALCIDTADPGVFHLSNRARVVIEPELP